MGAPPLTRYTYGQPVQGNAQIQVCRKFSSYGDSEDDNNKICRQYAAQLKNGCTSQMIDMEAFQLDNTERELILEIEAIIRRFDTIVIQERILNIIENRQMIERLLFEIMDPFYRNGIAYMGTLRLSGPNNTPMVSKLLQLELNGKPLGNYTTDENGEATFSIDTAEIFDPQLSMKAVYVRPKSCHHSGMLASSTLDAYFSVSRFYSESSSFLKIISEPKQLPCNQEKLISVLYSLNPEAYKDGSDVTFFYLVMVRRSIFLSGQHEVTIQAWNGNFSFPLHISADLAPMANLFVYTLHPGGEIIADNVKLQTDKCFKNKVSIEFSKEQARPGSTASLHLQAAPDSFCALRAVDRSVLLLKPEQELSPDRIYNLFPNIPQHGYDYGDLNLDDGRAEPCIPQKDLFYKGLYYTPSSNVWDGDVSTLLWDMGLKPFTNLHYRKPEVCSTQGNLPQLRPFPLPSERMMYGSGGGSASRDARDIINHAEQAIRETVRTHFPKTWIWDLIRVDSSGSANVSFLVPDTITQWEARAFCVNGHAGFGISPKASVVTYLPFFVDATFPASVVRNEQSDLVVTVFSYLTTCVEISVQLEASEHYEASINSPSGNDSDVLEAGGWKTYVWTITPKTLGKVNITIVATSKSSTACPNDASEQHDGSWKDTVVKGLLVEPEGIEKETTQSFLICPKGNKVSKQILLESPSNVVEESTTSFVTVVGDILGVTMQNLDSLLQTSYGCVEQKVTQLASDIFILDYLTATDQLTEDIKSKALLLLSNGYQSLLSFRNSDGSYDMFCQRNQKGSIRLSALTFMTLEKMKEYIFIDEAVPKQTLIWLSSKQRTNGCFRQDDKLNNGASEGNKEAETVLTAQVVGAFLEAGLDSRFPALRNGLYCLEEALSNGVTSVYTQAVLAYVFALAGKEQQVNSLLQILDQAAIKKNNMIHWEREEKPRAEDSPPLSPWALSPETERTCYVLLAVISQATQDLDYASKIMQRLAQQMNSHGGFSAMQDSTVCLLALTQYMKLTGSKPQNTITLSTEGSEEVFHVDNDNRLLVQRSKLSKGHGPYKVNVDGEGCTFIQATLRYNVPLPKKTSGFSLALKLEKSNSPDGFQTEYILTVTLM